MARRFVAAIVVSLLLTTCSGPANKAVGIRLVTRGIIEIRFLRCSGPVISVQLARVVGGLGGDANDRVLWHVTARTPQALTTVWPGTTPSGFREVAPFRVELRPGQAYAVEIRSDDFSYFSGFQLRELRTDRIVNGWGESLKEAEFLAQSAEVCRLPRREATEGPDGISPVVAFMLIPVVGLVCLGLKAGGMAFVARRVARSRSDRTTPSS